MHVLRFAVLPRLYAVLACLLGLAGAHARVIEEQIAVPVEVRDVQGRSVAQSIVVAVFRDDEAPRPYPVLVLNHGRAKDAVTRHALTVAPVYSDAARWLTGFGFIVAVPVRVGYGATGGPDVEYAGRCERENYPPGYLAAARQTLQVIDTLRRRPDVAEEGAVVMGQSYGGTTAITAASLNAKGIQAAINFAGGGGGRPETHPGHPCSPEALSQMFANYGKSSRVATLWLYSENDKYWGPQLPHEWFARFRAAGGAGELEQLRAFRDDGHMLFARAPGLWQPAVESFLRRQGFVPFARRAGWQ